MDFSPYIAARFRRAPRSARPGRLPGGRYRPTLELLEDRLAPATLMVNTLADSIGASQLSLRDAILAIDNGSYSGPATGQVSDMFGSNDTILFQSGLNGTLSLTTANGPLVISSNLTITDNPTLNAITISGQFAGSQTGVFEVTSAATASIAGLTITQGEDSNVFGAIDVQAGGALTVNGCTFDNNQSAGPGGGAILNAGTLSVTNSTFANNSGVAGGAIDNVSGATATLINCTISGNQATSASGTGGGVANAGTLSLLNTLVAQNTSAGSDPDVVGAFTSSGHNLIGNATGSTGLTNGVNGDQVGGAAPFTGDITNGLATIENVSSTAGLVVGQLVTDTAGALPAGTVIAVLGPHSITLSQAATSSQTGDTFTSSVCADLGPLQNNGGGIQAMALLPTSSAIDAGANSDNVLTVPTTDERGVSRPQAGTVDIGAFEANELVVTNLNDSGAGSLRDALTQSNSIPGTVVIDFQAGLTGTISLTTAALEVDHDDWIRGPGAALITVDGNLKFWCFGVDSQNTVSGPLYVAIAGLTMTRGEQTQGVADSHGGAISYRNSSPSPDELTIDGCVIENSGGSGVNGGGIYAEAALSLSNTQIINNTSGIYISSNGALDIGNSWIANNTGNGIFTDLNTVLTNSTISGNGGDAIYSGGGNDALVNCTVTGNNTGLQMHSLNGIGTYTNCTVVGNTTEDARTVVGNSGGNMIFANSIVGKMVVQFGIFTSQGNNIFTDGFPGTLQASDVVSAAITSSTIGSNGHLTPGKDYYEIGAVTATGTLISADYLASPFFNNQSVNLNWAAPVGVSGVTAYEIFRGTAIGGEQLIATVSAGTTSFTDTGTAGGSSVPALLGPLQNNGGAVPTMAPTAAGSIYFSNKANPAFAPFLDEAGFLRNPIRPGIGAFEPASDTPNTVSFSPAALPGIDQGLNYSQSITAGGGTGTGYLVSVGSGALPPGFTLTPGGAPGADTLAGTATSLGSFTFTLTGFDSAGDFGSKSYTLNVNPAPSITTTSLAIGDETTAYSQPILTSGGTGPFTWSCTGTLPSGITFNTSTGTFGGTPAAGSAGTYNNIQVTGTDSDNENATQTYSMTVHWIITTTTLASDWTAGTSGYSQTIATSGGAIAPIAFTVSAGTLPAGLSLVASTGLISGTPTSAGSSTFTITATDSATATASQAYTVVIIPPEFVYNSTTETLVITLIAAQPSFTYQEQATVNGDTTTLAYTFTLSGTDSPVSQTFTDAQLTTAPGTGASVTVMGQGLAGTAILITNAYLNGQTDQTPERISLGSLTDAGVGSLAKFVGNNTANPEYSFLALHNFPLSYAYAGRADGTIALYGTEGTGKVGFVTAGYYSYIASAVTGVYAHFGEGTPEVDGTSAGNADDFAYHYTSSLPSTASLTTAVYTVTGTTLSSMVGAQTNPEDGGAIDTFDNVAHGFVLNTAVAYSGNSIAHINDSPLSDTYVAQGTDPLGLAGIGGVTGFSYMYMGAFPSFAEFDALYGFGTYFASSTLGGHDIYYPGAPANNVFSGGWIQSFS